MSKVTGWREVATGHWVVPTRPEDPSQMQHLLRLWFHTMRALMLEYQLPHNSRKMALISHKHFFLQLLGILPSKLRQALSKFWKPEKSWAGGVNGCEYNAVNLIRLSILDIWKVPFKCYNFFFKQLSYYFLLNSISILMLMFSFFCKLSEGKTLPTIYHSFEQLISFWCSFKQIEV